MGIGPPTFKSPPDSKISFPLNHEDTLLYREFQNHYGGAQNPDADAAREARRHLTSIKTLHKIQDITRDVNILPGVDHNEIFSLASYRVAFSRAVPGALHFDQLHVPEGPGDAGGA